MNGDYFVSRNDWDLLFQVNKLDFEHIQKISLTELALQVEPETFLNEEEVEETQEQFASAEDQDIEIIWFGTRGSGVRIPPHRPYSSALSSVG